MKLLLSDGTAVAVKSYEKTSAIVNGNTVDAVSFAVEKTTLEKVKTLFGDSDNLDVLHIYSDENILLDTFNGYQIRKSIALGDADTSFVVVLAKSSEVTEQLNHITSEIGVLKESISSIATSVSALTENAKTLTQNQSDCDKKFTDQAKSIKEVTDALNEMKKSDSDQKDAVNNLEIDFGKIKKAFAELSAVAQTINEAYTSMTDSVNTANTASRNAVLTVDKAYNAMVSKSDIIDQLMDLMDEIKALATGNDEKVIKYNENASILTENVNSAKLAVEKFEETLSTVSKTVKDTTDQVKETQKSIESVNKNVTDLGNNVTSLTETAGKTAETVNSMDSRLTELEPVTDYTTLSLDDAKQFRIQESKKTLATYLETHPITSSCHGNTAAQYSITSEKQSFLQAMISITMLAAQNGIEYQPSWNKFGEACTYDWTLAELQQLAIEIEAVVRPLVSHQQALEKEILAVKNMKALQAVNISFDGIEPNPIVPKNAE